MFTYFYVFLNKRVHNYIVQDAYKKCLEMHDYVPIFLKYSGGGPPDSPFFLLVFIV